MSAAAARHAVVSGIGLVTPVGRGVGAFFDAVSAGRSGLRRIGEGPEEIRGLAAVGVAPAIDPGTVLPKGEGRCVDRFVLLALAAADDALADAGMTVGVDVDPDRVAVVVSSGAGGLTTYDDQALARGRRGRTAVSPFLLPGMLPNMAAARIAIRHGIRGYSGSISAACASGAQSVAEALRLVREGVADVVLCGGSDVSLNPTIIAAFSNARALAHGWSDPAAASRPFDKLRNGFVLAEGAGVLVVERVEHAEARRAGGYADLAGWGASSDAHHVTAPRPDGAGAVAAMRRALVDAGLTSADVGYVNAHGTGTKAGDLAEAAAVRTVFGSSGPAVSSTKGVTGHLLGAAGAVEAAGSALAVAAGTLPPTANLDDPDPDCALDHVRNSARARPVTAALSNSFAFGGHNVTLAFTRASTRLTRAPGDRE